MSKILILFCSLAVSLAADNFIWERLPGRVRQISAKGPELWAVNDNYQILEWNGKEWETRTGRAHHVAASEDGQSWVIDHFSNEPNKNTLRHDPNRQNEEPKFAAWFAIANGKVIDISAKDANTVLAIDETGRLTRYNNQTKNFERLTNGGTNNRDVSIGDNNEQWRLEHNFNLYRLDGNDWKQIQITSPVAAIARTVSVDGPNRVVVTTNHKNVYFYNGKEWKALVSSKEAAEVPDAFISATIGEKAVYGLTVHGEVWRVNV